MADVKLIPMGLGDIVANSGTLTAWGYPADTVNRASGADEPQSIEEIREYLEEISKRYGLKPAR